MSSDKLPRLSRAIRSSLKLEVKRSISNENVDYLAYQLWKENEQRK